MSIELLLYLTGIIPNIGKAAGMIMGLSIIGLALFTVAYYGCLFNDQKTRLSSLKKGMIISGVIVFMSTFLAIVTPTERTVYLIMGAKVGREVINSEVYNKVQDVVLKKLNQYLQEDK